MGSIPTRLEDARPAGEKGSPAGAPPGRSFRRTLPPPQRPSPPTPSGAPADRRLRETARPASSARSSPAKPVRQPSPPTARGPSMEPLVEPATEPGKQDPLAAGNARPALAARTDQAPLPTLAAERSDALARRDCDCDRSRQTGSAAAGRLAAGVADGADADRGAARTRRLGRDAVSGAGDKATVANADALAADFGCRPRRRGAIRRRESPRRWRRRDDGGRSALRIVGSRCRRRHRPLRADDEPVDRHRRPRRHAAGDDGAGHAERRSTCRWIARISPRLSHASRPPWWSRAAATRRSV